MLGYKLLTLLVLTVLFTTIASDVYAESITIKFDKSEYKTGDSLKITGQIPNVGMPVIAMSIYDPSGTILSANSLEVAPDGVFTKTLFLDSPFYEESGQYKVKFDYGQITQNEYFTIANSAESQIIEEPITPEIILLSTDKPQYTDGDTIKISGKVSVKDSPTVLIGVYDTFDAPAGFYFGNVNSDLSFSTNFLAVAGVNFKIDGTYSIKAHYAESSKNISFDFVEVMEVPIDENIFEDFEDILDEIDSLENDSPNNPASDSAETTSNDVQPDITETELVTPQPKETKKESTENKSIIQNTPQEKTTTQKSNEKQIIKESPSKKNAEKKSKENEKEDNLTVEDIALGIMLNQINLKCDNSKYVDSISYYDGMGPALYRLCKFDQSLDFFNQSLIKEPDNVEILVNKGSTLGKLGFYSEAIIYYDQALDISPDFVPAINNKANALANMGNLQGAKSLYEIALEKNQNYATARKNLSVVNEQLQNQFDDSPKIQNIQHTESKEQPASKQPIESKQPKQTKKENANFFDELTMAFSSIGSLFGFK